MMSLATTSARFMLLYSFLASKHVVCGGGNAIGVEIVLADI